jgi:methanogenic corrinoid protein MtbC1
MSHVAILDEIAHAITGLEDSAKVKELVSNALAQGIPANKIVEDGIRKGLEEVGQKYEKSEYFLSELLFAGELVGGCFDVLKPQLKKDKMMRLGLIVLGTVRGDIHDIGKNIFKMLAEAEGFEVDDMGVDVEPERFVDALRKSSGEILALSALLTTTTQEMKITMDELKKASMRHTPKVLLGGNAVTREFAREIGADDAGLTAVEGVEISKRWVAK